MSRLAPAIVVAALAAACAPAPAATSPSPPASADGGGSGGGSIAATATAARATPSPSPTPYTRAALPAVHRGMAVVVYGTETHGDEHAAAADRRFAQLATLGVNVVSLNFALTTPSVTASTVTTDPRLTPDDDQLRTTIRAAHANGLAVVLRPYLDEATLPAPEWRGTLRPADSAAWFARYTEVLAAYAALAEKEQVEAIVVGTELNSLEADPRWRAVVAAVRGVFGGRIGYSINYDRPYLLPWADALDFIGIDAFFPLQAPATATAEELERAWAPHAATLARGKAAAQGKPFVLTEVGVTSQTGAHRRPFAWDQGTPADEGAQARYYAATCAALRGVVDGMYWWSTTIGPTVDPKSFDPLGKAAEAELRRCFAS
ncbi:MAG TPA: hypothetical protein VGR87_10020 [Candidatus Limnocylindria bacterium]|nr:hypothetical protein [Candidatus Limnocylindria bacterium]